MAEPLAIDAWTEARFRAVVDFVSKNPTAPAELLGLLEESHPAYAQRGAAVVVRMRGHALLALMCGPNPWPAALPFALEELQSGHSPYLLAAAARVLQHVTSPHSSLAPFLTSALTTLSQSDDAVDLSRYGGTASDGDAAPAFDEVMRALQWLGPAAAGEHGALQTLLQQPGLAPEQRAALTHAVQALPKAHGHDSSAPQWHSSGDAPASCTPTRLNDVLLEDQDAQRLDWDELFVGAPTVLAFFYTRCDNARKCSLTISKLARMQDLLRQAGCFEQVRIAAITYDPTFDSPQRLRGYAASRGMQFAAGHRVLRVIEGHERLSRALGLGVSFVGSVVNRHRIEVFVLDSTGQVAAVHRRLQWREEELLEDVQQLLSASQEKVISAPAVPVSPSTPSARLRAAPTVRGIPGWTSTLLAMAIALFPKCPICGLSYLSMGSLVALPQLPGLYWTWPLIALASMINLAVLVWLARREQRWLGVALAAVGSVMLFGWGAALQSDWGLWGGVVLHASGALLSVWTTPQRVAQAV
ncbi:SCO family protein [Variovorax paradoxus]|nr:SCO family protein [Variovorax paradoxus]MBT2304200.1 SCO family protein [Variovorax paradoxus]